MRPTRRSSLSKLCLAAALALAGAGAPRAARAAGTWTKVASGGCASFGMWLLTDGRVLGHGCGGLNTWMILTPDKAGNYAAGTWKNVANSAHARGGAQQHVLKDGRLFVGGGEYIDGPQCTPTLCNTAEIYDPVSNTWKNTANAPHDIGDTGSATLADGTILESTRSGNQITVYDPATDTWTAKASLPAGFGSGDENSWASLQNGDVLAVAYASGGAALYIPAMDKWVKTAVPSGFATGDMAGISQMFDGRVYVYGLKGKAYVWTPGPAVTDPGSWTTMALLTTNGATEAEDEYTDTLPNGKVWGALVAVMYGPSVVLQEFDPVTNTVSAVTGLPAETNPDPIDYLNLPNGQVMITPENGRNNWVYTPAEQPDDSWRPTVSSVVYDSAANTYTLTGTQLSGLINGGDEGDDMTMAENYPIIWLEDTSGNVSYCKSFNFSNMMATKGATPETADFTTPAGLPNGSYSLYVSAVGVISKNPFPFTVGQSSMGTGGTSGGGGGTAGAGGTSGSTGSAGATGSGGGSGSTGSGGAKGSGGTTGSGGAAGGGSSSTGSAGTMGSGGGASTGSGGNSGSTGAGGVVSTGGNTGSGGISSTGSGGNGGSTGSGGSSSSGTGGSSGEAGSGGCSCETAPTGGSNLTAAVGLLGLGFCAARRRRSRARSS